MWIWLPGVESRVGSADGCVDDVGEREKRKASRDKVCVAPIRKRGDVGGMCARRA